MLRLDSRFDRRAAANADMRSRGAVPFREQYTFFAFCNPNGSDPDED